MLPPPITAKEELIARRTLLEVEIRECEKQGVDWRTAPLGKKYAAIEKALLALDPVAGPTVGLKTGVISVKAHKQYDTTSTGS
jgi:hypothetical protein